MDKSARIRKLQVYNSGKKQVFRLDLNDSTEGFCWRNHSVPSTVFLAIHMTPQAKTGCTKTGAMNALSLLLSLLMHVKVYVPTEQQLLTESVWRAHDGEDHGEEHQADLHLLPVTVSAHTAQPTSVSPPSHNATHTQLHLSSTPPEHHTCSNHWPFPRNSQNVRLQGNWDWKWGLRASA